VAPSEPSVDLVIDVDLSILGRDDLRFFEYEYAVAEEYSGVWSPAYFIARGRFLAALLAAPFIYRTPHFRARYEARARANLAQLLASPRYRLHRWASGLRSWFVQG
jgi:predicted metal-dependent HD superfamily phosphohydrolase